MKILVSEHIDKNPRRELRQLFTADIKQVNFYEASRGAILGDHFHKRTNEYFFITKGTFMVQIGDNSFPANPGTLFKVEPGEKHTLEALTNKGTFLTFLSKPYSKEDEDIFK